MGTRLSSDLCINFTREMQFKNEDDGYVLIRSSPQSRSQFLWNSPRGVKEKRSSDLNLIVVEKKLPIHLLFYLVSPLGKQAGLRGVIDPQNSSSIQRG